MCGKPLNAQQVDERLSLERPTAAGPAAPRVRHFELAHQGRRQRPRVGQHELIPHGQRVLEAVQLGGKLTAQEITVPALVTRAPVESAVLGELKVHSAGDVLHDLLLREAPAVVLVERGRRAEVGRRVEPLLPGRRAGVQQL